MSKLKPSDPGSPSFISTQVASARRFYLDLNPPATRALAVVCGGWEDCVPDYAIDRESFPFLSLEFVAVGSGEVVLAGQTHALHPGTVFTYGPGVRHEIRNATRRPMGKYFVDVVGGRAQRLLEESGLAPGTMARLTEVGEVRQAFETLIRFASGPPLLARRMCALQVELLVLAIARSRQPATRSERRARATFERCRREIDARFLELRTGEQAAGLCHVAVSHLCRMFRRFQGETPYRYVQRLQMDWAADRLRSSGRLIREVADELGVDPFQFSRTFKRIHGVSPSRFLAARG